MPSKKPRKPRKQVYQNHHIVYASDEPTLERVVKVTRGEHYLITQLQRFKSLTFGAVQAILHEVGQKSLREEVKKEGKLTNE